MLGGQKSYIWLRGANIETGGVGRVEKMHQEMVPLVESDIFITYFIPIFNLFSPIFSVFFQKCDYFITIYQIS
jgi:hypothetical protein